MTSERTPYIYRWQHMPVPPSRSAPSMNGFLLVFVGGGLGAAARHGINSVSGVLFGSRYPMAPS